jgi:DNA-binding MarR family transcriptional regulator/predicted N-acetyltransferase YhbS
MTAVDAVPQVAGPDIAELRRFNRAWTVLSGLLEAGMHETPYTLTEARVLYEVARAGELDVADLRRSLQLDAGYLSRILQRFRSDGLVLTGTAAHDARRQTVRAGERGLAVFAELEQRSDARAAQVLGPLAPADREHLVTALVTVRGLVDPALGDRSGPGEVTLRAPRPGDLGWVVERHGAIYEHEYGWGLGFEALTAGIVAGCLGRTDPDRERGWIAELDGRRVGCVFCVQASPEVAKLRLLLVEPSARGHGIGGALVGACVDFARQAGYGELVLWTVDQLHAARRLYQAAGFRLVSTEPHDGWGVPVTTQTWSLELRSRLAG